MNDGTHFSTPHATVRNGGPASGYAPEKRPRPAVASLLTGVKAHLGLLALAGSVVTCLVYLFFGDGSWMFALTEASGIGFAPDPAYWTANAGASTIEALTCSAFAGAVFLPFIALGGLRALLRSRLFNRRPVGLASARHITLAAGGGRSSSRLAPRSGSL